MINSISTDLLQKGLDALWLRQRVISNNIANATTPGYKSKSVEFESMLRAVMDRKNPDGKALVKAVNKINPELVDSYETTDSEDGNNVVLDKENIELARAQLQYTALITALNAQINRMKFAITGGQ